MKKAILLSAALSTALLFGCEDTFVNDRNLLTEEEEAVIMEDAAADNVMEATDYEVDFYSSSQETINGINNKKSTQWNRWRYVDGVGPSVTVNPTGTAYPKTITIDYGEGIELVNGRIISGKIIIDVAARPLTDGATREVTYSNFYVDSVHIAGGATRTFAGTDSTQRVFSNVSDLTLTFPDGAILERHGERTRTLAEGFETLFDHSDDLVLIEGLVDYKTSNGKTFSKTVTYPLTKKGDCRFIVEGTVSFTLNGENFAQLDYGDGTCDDIATITKDGETRQITIGRRLRKFWRR